MPLFVPRKMNYGTQRHTGAHRGTHRHIMSTNIQVQRICQHCGKEFTARTTVTRFCSNACSSKAYKANVKTLKIRLSNRETQQIASRPFGELMAKPFLSILEASRLLGVSRRTIYRMLGRGDINSGKAGTRTIIKRSDIDSIFQKQKDNGK